MAATVRRTSASLRSRLEALPALRRLAGGDEPETGVVLAQGLVASVMIVVGSWGVGWLASSQLSIFARTVFLNPLRVEPAGVIACTLLLAFGSMLLCRSWLRLGQRGGWGPAAMPTVRRAVLLWGAPLLLSFPIFSRDVYSYIGQGRLLHAGLSPYENWISQLPGWFAEGSDSLWAESPSPYGPLFLLGAQAVYFFTGGVPEAGVLLFRLFAAAGVLLCLKVLPQLAARLGSEPAWALWISVANPLFLLNMVAGVHNDAVMLGVLLWAFLLVFRGRRLAGVLAASVAIAIKPIVVLALPFLGLAMLPRDAGLGRRIRAWTFTAVVAGGALAFFGWASGLWFGWIKAMATAGSAAFPYAPVGLLGLAVGWIGSLAGGDLNDIAEVVYALFKVAAIGLTAWLALRRPADPPVLACAYALTAAVVLAPIIQPWYLLWLAPLFAASRVYDGAWVRSWYILTLVLVLVGVVDQLSVAQWIDLTVVRLIAAAVGLAYLAYIVFVDPRTATMFGSGRFAARFRKRFTRRAAGQGDDPENPGPRTPEPVTPAPNGANPKTPNPKTPNPRNKRNRTPA
ncbi:polyprenol phosphomannose-dependent alpha 1,6 mannosyltransferase MptB [Arthrobacter ginkgonis]|uniref:Polyprenol phosphomannose-dependent alpha 1,6 mannosyltransferase MptB n=1 Tax=Arthrobacter ginkgonis TaxID=1630594 RepID=A0ABP7D7L3_9MICC